MACLKMTFGHLCKVSSRISLRSLRRLIREGTLRLQQKYYIKRKVSLQISLHGLRRRIWNNTLHKYLKVPFRVLQVMYNLVRLLVIFVYLSSLPVAHLSDAPRRRLVVTGDSARIQNETAESSAWFFPKQALVFTCLQSESF